MKTHRRRIWRRSHEQSIAQRSPRSHEQQLTVTIQNRPDSPDVTTNNEPSLTITTDPNLLDKHVRQMTEQERNNQQPDDAFSISLSNTNIKQPLQTQHLSQRNYEPPHVSPQKTTHSTLQNSPQQGSSNSPITIQNQPEVQF